MKVTQEDRERAAKLSECIAGKSNGRDQIAECRKGKQDNTHLVQAFAAHREAAEARVVEWLAREMYEPFVPLDMAKAYKRALEAIEAGEHLKG